MSLLAFRLLFFQLFNHIRGALNVTLGLIGAEIKLLMDLRLSLVQRIHNVEHGGKCNQTPDNERQRSEQVA